MNVSIYLFRNYFITTLVQPRAKVPGGILRNHTLSMDTQSNSAEDAIDTLKLHLSDTYNLDIVSINLIGRNVYLLEHRSSSTNATLKRVARHLPTDYPLPYAYSDVAVLRHLESQSFPAE